MTQMEERFFSGDLCISCNSLLDAQSVVQWIEEAGRPTHLNIRQALKPDCAEWIFSWNDEFGLAVCTSNAAVRFLWEFMSVVTWEIFVTNLDEDLPLQSIVDLLS